MRERINNMCPEAKEKLYNDLEEAALHDISEAEGCGDWKGAQEAKGNLVNLRIFFMKPPPPIKPLRNPDDTDWMEIS